MSRSFLINLMLAVVWTVVSGTFNGTNLIIGFVLGYIVLLIAQPLIEVASYGRRIIAIIDLAAIFLLDLMLSSLRVAKDILSPMKRLEPGVIALPLEVTSDIEITVFANLISLTPGTLTLAHSDDRRYLFIHVMNIPNRDVKAEQDRIKNLLEDRVRKAFGPVDK